MDFENSNLISNALHIFLEVQKILYILRTVHRDTHTRERPER
jgi:hypothetical protein